MTDQDDLQPWETLEDLLEAGDQEGLADFMAALPAHEAARVILRLDREDQERLLRTLAPSHAADLVRQIPDAEAADIMELVEPHQAAAILEELPSDEQVDLLLELGEEQAEAILRRMDPEDADQILRMAAYPPDTAGGLMVTEYLRYPQEATAQQVVDDLREKADEYRDYDVQYAYVVSDQDGLVGVLRMRDLLLASKGAPLRDLLLPDPLTVRETADLDELSGFFDEHAFVGVPVVDTANHIIGVVQRRDVDEALAERSDSDYRKSQGIVGGEELRSMPVFLRSRRRLAWLSVNIVLNVIAASIIAMYQETLASVIALAVFLPIISDMSGCSGNQAVAVSMRELALGLVHPNEVRHVWVREISVGMINGLVLGLLLALVALAWKGNVWLGLVVGSAMAANTLVAVSIGGAVPLILKRLGKDPALASGPILTTITDMFGFFLVLSLASAFLARLT